MTDTTAAASRPGPDLSVDQQLALHTAAMRLRRDFEGVEGLRHNGRPIVLFLCVHNAGRSQMALGFLTHLAGDAVIGWSGGQEPGIEINPAAVAAMAERGINIAAEYPKPWTEQIVQAADVVITMGCGDACPIFPGKRYEDWELDDPAGKPLEQVRPIRDEIERRVRHLLEQLEVPVSS